MDHVGGGHRAVCGLAHGGHGRLCRCDVRTGDVIEGLDGARSVEGVSVFCAGVGADPDGRLVTAGGRVLAVTGQGPDLASARGRAYEAVGHIGWPGMHHRNDIASAAVADADRGGKR